MNVFFPAIYRKNEREKALLYKVLMLRYTFQYESKDNLHRNPIVVYTYIQIDSIKDSYLTQQQDQR